MRAMHKRKYLLGASLCLALLLAFTSCHRKSVNGETLPDEVTGNDRDAHGCIGSAGYTWSQLSETCIRVWEDGIQLTDVQHVGGTGAAYLVSGATEAEKELFLPGSDAGILLTKKGKAWKDAGGDYEVLQPLEGAFEVYDAQGVLLFKSISK